MRYPNIEAERARLGMTKQELSESVGVSAKTYQNWQDSKTEIPGSKIISMVNLFEVSADYLLGLSNTPKS